MNIAFWLQDKIDWDWLVWNRELAYFISREEIPACICVFLPMKWGGGSILQSSEPLERLIFHENRQKNRMAYLKQKLQFWNGISFSNRFANYHLYLLLLAFPNSIIWQISKDKVCNVLIHPLTYCLPSLQYLGIKFYEVGLIWLEKKISGWGAKILSFCFIFSFSYHTSWWRWVSVCHFRKPNLIN